MFKFLMSKSAMRFISIAALIMSIFSSSVWANPLKPDPLVGSSTSKTSNVKVSKPVVIPRRPKLSDILIIGEYKTAMLNNKEHQIGDIINSYKLVEIFPSFVRLQRGSRTYLLELKVAGNLTIEPAKED